MGLNTRSTNISFHISFQHRHFEGVPNECCVLILKYILFLFLIYPFNHWLLATLKTRLQRFQNIFFKLFNKKQLNGKKSPVSFAFAVNKKLPKQMAPQICLSVTTNCTSQNNTKQQTTEETIYASTHINSTDYTMHVYLYLQCFRFYSFLTCAWLCVPKT